LIEIFTLTVFQMILYRGGLVETGSRSPVHILEARFQIIESTGGYKRVYWRRANFSGNPVFCMMCVFLRNYFIDENINFFVEVEEYFCTSTDVATVMILIEQKKECRRIEILYCFFAKFVPVNIDED
tara:strand:+ start:254 stop:634 length:381 start_codon:yes stop_codon:yes gene_type:complete